MQFLLFLLVVAFLYAQAEVLSSSKQEKLFASLEALLNGGEASFKDAYFAARALDIFGKYTSKKQVCNRFDAFHGDATDPIASAFFQMGLKTLSGCEGKQLLSFDPQKLLATVGSPSSLRDLAHSVLLLEAQGEASYGLKPVVLAFAAMQDSASGLFFDSVSQQGLPTIENTVLAMDALAVLKERVGDVDDGETAAALQKIVDGVIRRLPDASHNYADDFDLEPSLLVPLKMASTKSLKVGSKQILAITAFSLQQATPASSPERTFRALRTLEFVSELKIAPLFVQVEGGSALLPVDTQKRKVSFNLVDLFGNPQPVHEVVVEEVAASSALSLDRETLSSLLKPVGGTKGEDGQGQGASSFVLDLSSLPLDASGSGSGLLDVTLAVKKASSSKAVQQTLRVKALAAPVQVSSPLFGVNHNKRSIEEGDLRDLSLKGESTGTFSYQQDHVMHVFFTLTAPFQPHQTQVVLKHKESGVHTYFNVMKREQDGEATTYESVISLNDDSENLLFQSGDYELHLFVGDASLAAWQDHFLASMHLTLRSEPKVEYSLYSRSLTHDQEHSLQPLPLKHHTFRSEEKQPPRVVSAGFAMGVLAVTAVFLLRVLSLGNLSLLATSSSLFLSGSLFFLSILGTLLILSYYWLYGDVFATLWRLFYLSLVVLVFGYYTLRHVGTAYRQMQQGGTGKEKGE